MSVLRFLLSLCNVSSASKRSGFAARPVHTILLVAMALNLVAPLISGLPTARAAPLPVPTTLESPLPAPSPEPEVPALSIQITTDPAVVEPGGPFTVTVTVMNRGPEDWSGSLLVSWIGSPLTFSVSVPGGETIEYTQRMVMPPSVELGPVELGVRLLEEGVLAAETTGVIGAASGDAPWAVDAWGGSFHSADGRVRVGFPAGAVDRLVQVSVTSDVMPEGIERGPGQFIRFSLSARDGVGNEIRAFARPVALRIDARGLFPNNVLPSGWQPYLITREGDEGPWTEVPITFEDGFLLAETRHFSEWASGAVAEGWQPVYTPPVANLFSGALTYRFPLQVPPGRSGLQPELGLSYSSRGLDGVITGTNVMESSPVAFGWSIDGLIEVVRDNTHHKWDGAHYRLHMYDQFTLLVGGTGYELEPNTSGQLCGRYQARNAPHLYVERRNEMCQNGSSSTTTDYWVIRLPDGTEAILGDTDSSQAVMSQYYNLLVCHGYCSPQNQTRGAQRYRVRQTFCANMAWTTLLQKLV
jgi:hypothetical protein